MYNALLNGLEKIEEIKKEGSRIEIYYTITDEYMKEHELYYKHRTYSLDASQPENTFFRESDHATINKKEGKRDEKINI